MSMKSSRPYLVRALYEWILDNGCTPYLLVDATVAGVDVPQQYVKNGQIVLNVAPGAVAGIDMSNDEIRFRGRFGGDRRGAGDLRARKRPGHGVRARAGVPASGRRAPRRREALAARREVGAHTSPNSRSSISALKAFSSSNWHSLTR